MRYKLQLLPQNPNPSPLDLTLSLKPIGEPGAPPAGPGGIDCGHCEGILVDPDDGTIANTGTTTFTFFPEGMDLGPWPQSGDYETTGHNDGFELVPFVHWVVYQQSGAARTPTITNLGPTVQDGLQIVFDSDADGGAYDSSICFLVTISRPDPWFGVDETGNADARSYGCESVFICGVEPGDDEVYLTISDFDWGSGAEVQGFPGNPYVAYTGTEPPNPWTATITAHGFPSGVVIWDWTPLTVGDYDWDAMYHVFVTGSTATTLSIQGVFVGGTDPDSFFFHATDSVNPAIVAPAADGGVYADGDATIRGGTAL